MKEQEKEDKEGIKVKVNVGNANNSKDSKSNKNAYDWGDEYEDDIAEDIQSEEDEKNNKVLNLLESAGGGQFGVTVSQSLGIDKSVDSLALDEYDHVEFIEKF